MNFHFDLFARMGFEAESVEIRAHYLAGRRADAVAAVTASMVEAIALVGPRAKIRDELDRWRSSLLTTMLVDGSPDLMRTMAELRDAS
jgi:hypothetical protein